MQHENLLIFLARFVSLFGCLLILGHAPGYAASPDLGPPRPAPRIRPLSPKGRALLRWLAAPSLQVRLRAALALKQLGEAAATPRLAQELLLPSVLTTDGNIQITSPYKKQIVSVLAGMGEAALPSTLVLLRAMSQYALKKPILSALSKIVRDPRHCKAALAAAMSQRVSQAGWRWAAQQVARFGPHTDFALAPLLGIFKRPGVDRWYGAYVATSQLKQLSLQILSLRHTLPNAAYSVLLGTLPSAMLREQARELLRAHFATDQGLALISQTLQRPPEVEAAIFAASQAQVFRAKAAPLVPAMLALLQRPTSAWGRSLLLQYRLKELYTHILKAFATIGPKAAQAVPLLLGVLENQRFRKVAARSLEQVVQQPGPYSKLFLATLANPKQAQGRLFVLKKLQGASRALQLRALPLVLPLLAGTKSKTATRRTLAAHFLVTLGKDALPGLKAMNAALQPQKGKWNPPALQMALLRAISALGPKAARALPVVLAVMNMGGEVGALAVRVADALTSEPLGLLAFYQKVLRGQGSLSKSYVVRQLYRLKLTPTKAELSDKRLKEALRLLADATLVPRFLHISGAYMMAREAQQKGKGALALRVLGVAISHGYDDYYTLHTDAAWKGRHKDPVFRKLYSSLRMSLADQVELSWLLRERLTIEVETSAMISENFGREDNDLTYVPQSSIPQRLSQSYAVWSQRRWVVLSQMRQRSKVMISDSGRRTHNSIMSMLSTSNLSGRQLQRYRVQLQMRQQMSRLRARSLARMRVQRVRNRQFQLPKSLKSTAMFLPKGLATLVPCPPLPSIQPPTIRDRKAYLNTYFQAAQRALRAREYPQALGSIKAAQKLSPDDPGVLRLLAQYQRFARKNPKAAYNTLTRAIKAAPKQAMLWYLRASVAYQQKLWQLCLSDCHQTLQRQPKWGAALNLRAITYGRLGQFGLAIRDLLAIAKLPKPGMDIGLLRANLMYMLLRNAQRAQAMAIHKRTASRYRYHYFYLFVMAYLTITGPGPLWKRQLQTLAWLRQAVQKGFRLFAYIDNNPHFQSLWQLPTYKLLKADHKGEGS